MSDTSKDDRKWISRHGENQSLFREMVRCLRGPCMPYLTNFDVSGELWELPNSSILIRDPELAYRAESVFMQRHPLWKTARESDWHREMRSSISYVLSDLNKRLRCAMYQCR